MSVIRVGLLPSWQCKVQRCLEVIVSLKFKEPSLQCLIYVRMVTYSGKLSREKTFTNFAIFQPSAKFSP